MTCSTFAFKSTNNSWSGKLININNENPIPHDLTGYDKAYIIFKKPDGTQYPTDEQMEPAYALYGMPDCYRFGFKLILTGDIFSNCNIFGRMHEPCAAYCAN